MRKSANITDVANCASTWPFIAPGGAEVSRDFARAHGTRYTLWRTAPAHSLRDERGRLVSYEDVASYYGGEDRFQTLRRSRS